MIKDDSPLLPIRVLHDFSRRMEDLDITYMLTGSLAMFQYSTYRLTADIDVVVNISTRDADRLIAALEPDYYVPHDSMRRAIESRRMFNVLDRKTAFKIDCVMLKPEQFHKEAFERRVRVDFHGQEIDIITCEDLIVAKLLWAEESRSEKQLTDVRNLSKNPLDTEHIKTWTRRLGLEELYLTSIAN